jgi:hypothetical protein
LIPVTAFQGLLDILVLGQRPFAFFDSPQGCGQGRPRHSRRYLNLSGVSYLAGEVNYLGHLGRGDDSGDHAEETD